MDGCNPKVYPEPELCHSLLTCSSCTPTSQIPIPRFPSISIPLADLDKNYPETLFQSSTPRTAR
jgi:hypothetical protein